MHETLSTPFMESGAPALKEGNEFCTWGLMQMSAGKNQPFIYNFSFKRENALRMMAKCITFVTFFTNVEAKRVNSNS